MCTMYICSEYKVVKIPSMHVPHDMMMMKMTSVIPPYFQ